MWRKEIFGHVFKNKYIKIPKWHPSKEGIAAFLIWEIKGKSKYSPKCSNNLHYNYRDSCNRASPCGTKQAWQIVLQSAESFTGGALLNLEDMYNMQYGRGGSLKVPSHSNNSLFQPLLSGLRLHSYKANTERLPRSFFHQAIQILNMDDEAHILLSVYKNYTAVMKNPLRKPIYTV